ARFDRSRKAASPPTSGIIRPRRRRSCRRWAAWPYIRAKPCRRRLLGGEGSSPMALTTDLDAQRRFYAEEIQIASNLRSTAIVDALAAVPREQFLPPGPWTIRGESDLGGPLRQTPGDDPRFVYHNVSIAIDPARMLFNGAPSVMGMAIDRAMVGPGCRVAHIGAGTGYFTALMGHCVGPTGFVLGVEADAALAERAAANLRALPSVEIRHGDGTGPMPGPLDAVLVNAGVTHPRHEWLDA